MSEKKNQLATIPDDSVASKAETSDCPADFTNLLRQDKYEHQPIQQPTESID